MHSWLVNTETNYLRIWFIFSTRLFVLNAVKEPGNFGGGCMLIKNKSFREITFNIIISPTHTPCKIVKSQRDL